ncbi:hypothetical protein H257_08900 [Aphanomyces astaci]|uniref:subtilisin n=1 Tax=Aphanomyces astaci TaxID=112090 RepID=W4GCT8_APHAT|nr:hypothetical protein H257_08900 [Aphanomyces astaci]ETV77490.1 hypothetical protein H257_08900 [Aphanomyces astaci]|eukprot:XP_009833277.1 hypothetical protein H257_08900 [Aphanomyces astaci]
MARPNEPQHIAATPTSPINITQAALVLSLAASAVAASKVSVRVDQFFESGTESTLKANVLVKFNVAIAALETGAKASTAPRQYVFDFLKEAAEKNEAKLAGLVPADATVTSLFIGGAASISGVTKATLDALTALNVVTYVDLNANDFSRPEVLQGSASTEEDVAATNEWGVDAVGGPEIWNYTTGQGVVVGSIDTGAINTHEAIKHNYRAENGWFDPYNKTSDSDGHGAHTIGTTVARTASVWPPAPSGLRAWVCTKNRGQGKPCCSARSSCCAPASRTALAPTASKGPHVVNNSWGADAAYHPWFEAAVAAWKAPGIIPVFANGN